jgi:hypothetical protein
MKKEINENQLIYDELENLNRMLLMTTDPELAAEIERKIEALENTYDSYDEEHEDFWNEMMNENKNSWENAFDNFLTESKKNSTELRLKEIEKEGNRVAIEAKIAAIDEEIEKCNAKLSKIDENEDLQDYINPNSVKEIQKEIKILEKQKQRYEKIYGKMNKSNKKTEIVDEDTEIEFDDTINIEPAQ